MGAILHEVCVCGGVHHSELGGLVKTRKMGRKRANPSLNLCINNWSMSIILFAKQLTILTNAATNKHPW